MDEKEHPGAQDLDERMADPVGIARVVQVLAGESGQPESVGEIPNQECPGVRTQALGPSLDDHGVVEIWREQRTLQFTHGVSLGCRDEGVASHPHLIAAQEDTPWAFYALTMPRLVSW